MQNQVYAFIIFIIDGLLIGILFDIFRIIRKSFRTPDIITHLEDLIFWIITGLILLYSIFKFNSGELRMYILIGIFLGVTIYMLIFSKTFVEISVYIIKMTKKIIYDIIFVPLKYIGRFLRKKLIISINSIIKNTKIYKKTQKKKDFI